MAKECEQGACPGEIIHWTTETNPQKKGSEEKTLFQVKGNLSKTSANLPNHQVACLDPDLDKWRCFKTIKGICIQKPSPRQVPGT